MVMKVISTNIAEVKTVFWRGNSVRTGIYKYPTKAPIHLGKEDVTNDAVVDRRYHGGPFKACYLFGSDYYSDWKKNYPDLEWNWGMFGENLTVEGLTEDELEVGAIYALGEARIQISEPRQPCYKFGIRMGTQQALSDFLAYGHPGTYVKVLREGKVSINDSFQLEKRGSNQFTIADYNILVNQRKKEKRLIRLALENDALSTKNRTAFEKLV